MWRVWWSLGGTLCWQTGEGSRHSQPDATIFSARVTRNSRKASYADSSVYLKKEGRGISGLWQSYKHVCRQYGGTEASTAADAFKKYVLVWFCFNYFNSPAPKCCCSNRKQRVDSRWLKLDPDSGGRMDVKIVSSIMWANILLLSSINPSVRV